MKILITGHDTFHNKGCQALIFTTTEILKQAFPDASFTVFSWEPEYDEQHFYNNLIECTFIRHRFQTGEFSARNRFWFFLNYYLGLTTDRILWVKPSFYEAIKSCDLVVVSGGDILGDYGKEAVKHYFFPIAVAIALRKPVFVFAQSISQHKHLELRRFCKSHLDKVRLITVREQLSYDYMKELKVKAPVYRTADPAFTLQPCSPERRDEIAEKERFPAHAKPLIGLSVSRTVTRWGGREHGKFAQEIVNAVDVLSGKYRDAQFAFIPHVTYRNDPKNDDRVVAREIYDKLTQKDQVSLVEGDYDCQESKALIGLCDIFIGARTHSTIASASQLVPTIALAYSTKAYGIMQDVLDQKRCVLDIKDFSAEKLMAMVDRLLDEKCEVVDVMKEQVEKLRKAALRNGELAKQLMEGSLN